MSPQPPPPPPPTGGFKLKLKLGNPPPQPQPPPTNRQQNFDDEDQEEDQLEPGQDDEDDSGSLSSPPPPPPPQPAQKRPKAKEPAGAVSRPSKKRKSQPSQASTSSHQPQSAPPHQPIQQQQQAHPRPMAHTQFMNEEMDSELSSYASEPVSQPPKPKKIKLAGPSAPPHSQPPPPPPQSQQPKPPPKPKMPALADVELQSAGGSQISEETAPVTSIAPKPAPKKKKKKKKSLPAQALQQTQPQPLPAPAVSKDAARQPSTAVAPPSLAPPPQAVQPLETAAASQAPGPLPISLKPPSKPATVFKSKVKKGSKPPPPKNEPIAQPAEATQPVPFTFPPPRPRPTHDYSLGPPPPPPVAAYKSLPIGPAPKPQGQFLPAQILDKRSPKVRSWKKQRRQVVGVSGIPFWVWTYVGDEHSDYSASKQSKLAQLVGTPNTSQQINGYFPNVQPSRPGSAASTHTKPSPARNAGSHSRSKYQAPPMAEPAMNLGGPVLPPSFRRPPPSTGSPLSLKSIASADVTIVKPPSRVVSRAKQIKNIPQSNTPIEIDLEEPVGSSGTVPTAGSQDQVMNNSETNQSSSSKVVSPGIIRLSELAIPK